MIENEKDKLEMLQVQVEDIQKQLSYLNKHIIPKLEGNSGGGEKEWITFYDNTSEDPNINLGYPKGITGSLGYISNMPDLSPYRYMKFYFYTKYAVSTFFYDLEKDGEYFSLFTNDREASVYMFLLRCYMNNDKKTLSFSYCYKRSFPLGKVPTISSMLNNYDAYIMKIEVCY